jgi:hypothetical protein
MASYPEKYNNFFKNIVKTEPESPKKALELLVQKDYIQDITSLMTDIQQKKFPLQQLKQIYEKYPQFQDYGGYVNGANNYINTIHAEIEEFNIIDDEEQRESKLAKISALVKLLRSHVEDYPINGNTK